jgi:hypothetical protein
MKRKTVILSALLICCGMTLYAQNNVSLDQALKTAAAEFSQKLEKGSTVAVIQIRSDSVALSDYMIDELNNQIVNIGSLTAVNRRQLDLIRGEINFNDTEEVNQASQQQAGRMLGAKSIITGSLSEIGGVYRLSLQSLLVEGAVIQANSSVNVDKRDRIVQNLILEESDDVQDYTISERAAMAGLNVIFGTGSWMKKDFLGGGITAATEGVGLVLMLYGIIDAASYRGEYDGGVDDPPVFDTYATYIGAGLLGGGAIFGIIRGFTYHKPGATVGFANPDNWNIAVLPGKNGRGAVQMSYTLRF